ncbi:MAG: hypothetical protein K5705_06345 [Oscillospiraceae bacterium]|nr:hypothetical protein [Oscillospiraceae bacterium]
MNTQQYRDAVSRIRWSDEKRTRIESMLQSSETIPLKNETDWEESSQNKTVAITRNNIGISEEKHMKLTRTKRYMVLGLAAAVLATGGAVASIAAHSNRKSDTLDITYKNGVTLHLTNEQQEPFYSSQHFYQSLNRGADDSLRTITPVETGWVYWRPAEHPRNGHQNYILYYSDTETGESVPICARPDCEHDGSEKCVASTSIYEPSALTYHDGYLYSMTTKYLHPEKVTDPMPSEISSADCKQVLLRYSADGTGIKELCDFGYGKGNSRCYVSRGYVWCLVQIQNVREGKENAFTNESETFRNGGWEIWGYELATGKAVPVYKAMPDEKYNQVNDTPAGFSVYGDYIYFSRQGADWSGSQSTLARISLLTGKEEAVLNSQQNIGCFSGTQTLFFTGSEDRFAVKNLKTLAESRTVNLRELIKKTVQKKICTSPSLIDDRYVYIRSNYYNSEDLNGPDAEKEGRRLTVLTPDLDIVSTFYLPQFLAPMESDEEDEIYDYDVPVFYVNDCICVYRDRLYYIEAGWGSSTVENDTINALHCVVSSCALDDITAADNPEFRIEFSY